MTTVKGVVVFALTLVMLLTSACENTDPTPAEREAIDSAVRGYLGALADAYSTLDPNVLDGHTSPNEKAAVHKLLKELLLKSGDRIVDLGQGNGRFATEGSPTSYPHRSFDGRLIRRAHAKPQPAAERGPLPATGRYR